ncbi:hypothetical protein [Amycolatopsis taiwanensis]|uniref:Uncharacterized protein n=1 Tax=Amycolatopsis taiwanensis TaxID=342230 RepID=A0A9W6VEQ2_9PSEU|nr:hypothetical protein [Amycolatopsis taiwanensis]GLY68723.1 hypothetical protein Atai01_53420 [Amycolatopsis taiwanensis]
MTRWEPLSVLESTARPWIERRSAVVEGVRVGETGRMRRLRPSDLGPIALTVRDYGASFDLFVDDYAPPFELDPEDARDRDDYEHIILAVLNGNLAVELATTIVGKRARKISWDSGEWSFPRELGLSSIDLRKVRLNFPAYR